MVCGFDAMLSKYLSVDTEYRLFNNTYINSEKQINAVNYFFPRQDLPS